MKDWKAIASANGLGAKEIDVILQPLTALEETFRPLVRDLTPDLEPAFGFHADGESE